MSDEYLNKAGLDNLWAKIKSVFAKKTELNEHIDDTSKHIPTGGSTGQVLKKTSSGVEWGTDNDTTYTEATSTDDGLMPSEMYTKLDGIETGANNYTHPSTHAASMITGLSDVATSGSYNDLSDTPTSMAPTSHTHAQSDITGLATALSGKSDTSHTHTAATTTANGYMSAADKTKLDGIATGATSTTVDSALSTTSTNPVQNKIVNAALSGKANSSHTHTLDNISETTNKKIMTATERNKLSGIETGANNYTHPTSHAASMITGLSDVATSGSYDDLSGKPTTMTPSAHTHAQSDITGLTAALSEKLGINDAVASAAKLETARNINYVSFDGTSNITIPLRSARVYKTNASTTVIWFKYASCTFSSGTRKIAFYMHNSGSCGDLTGIIEARAVIGTSGITCELKWICAGKNVDTDDFVIVSTQDGTNYTVELWARLETNYTAYIFSEIMNTDIANATDPSLWTLYRISSTNGSTAYTSGTAVVSSMADDTGWLSLTAASTAPASIIQYRKVGKEVAIRGYAVPAAGGTACTIGTLPSGYRPSMTACSSIDTATSAGIYGCTTVVQTNGSMLIGGTLTSGRSYTVNLTYFID